LKVISIEGMLTDPLFSFKKGEKGLVLILSVLGDICFLKCSVLAEVFLEIMESLAAECLPRLGVLLMVDRSEDFSLFFNVDSL